tara:strand:+ start:316 stop:486 length:171 start_codon:yes stop_codon:yes gene_type:complete
MELNNLQKKQYSCLTKKLNIKKKKPSLKEIFYLTNSSNKMCPKNKGKKCKCKNKVY